MMAHVRMPDMPRIGRLPRVVVGGLVVWLAVSGAARGAERDLYSGLAYLRAGDQIRAEESLRRYRDAERDPEIRRSVDRVLLLLGRPLDVEVREYIATSLEERARPMPSRQTEGARSRYWSRMFPVFP